MTEAQVRRVISDLYRDLTGETLPSSTVKEYFSRWLRAKGAEIVELTSKKYAATVKEFLRFLGARGDLDITLITTAEIAAFRDGAAAKSTPTTANNKLKILRAAFKSAWRDGLIVDDPAAKTPVIKSRRQYGIRRPFTIPEVHRILEVADAEWEGMILFGLYTGQRLRDIALITWENVDLLKEEIRLSTHKTGRRQIIPMTIAVKRWLMDQVAGDDPRQAVFPRAFGMLDRGISISTLSSQFHGILVAAGLARARSKKSTGKGRAAKREVNELSFHSLRRTATSLLKNAGVSESVVMDLIGHQSKLVSTHYTTIDESAKRNALERLPDILAD